MDFSVPCFYGVKLSVTENDTRAGTGSCHLWKEDGVHHWMGGIRQGRNRIHKLSQRGQIITDSGIILLLRQDGQCLDMVGKFMTHFMKLIGGERKVFIIFHRSFQPGKFSGFFLCLFQNMEKMIVENEHENFYGFCKKLHYDSICDNEKNSHSRHQRTLGAKYLNCG